MAELPGARVLCGVVCVCVPSFGVDTYRLTSKRWLVQAAAFCREILMASQWATALTSLAYCGALFKATVALLGEQGFN